MRFQPHGGSADCVATWFWRVALSTLGSQSFQQSRRLLKRTNHQVSIGSVHLSTVTQLESLSRPPCFASTVINFRPIALGRKSKPPTPNQYPWGRDGRNNTKELYGRAKYLDSRFIHMSVDYIFGVVPFVNFLIF